MNDSPHPHVPLEFGFLKMNLEDNLSSNQSISEPTMENKALESINTLTPSCSINSSNLPGWSTYSKLYVKPEQPLFLTPILMSLGCGWFNKACKWSTALDVNVINAFLGRNTLFFFVEVELEVVGVEEFIKAVVVALTGVTVGVGMYFGCSISVMVCDGMGRAETVPGFFVSKSFKELFENLDVLDLLIGILGKGAAAEDGSVPYSFMSCLDHLSEVEEPEAVFWSERE